LADLPENLPDFIFRPVRVRVNQTLAVPVRADEMNLNDAV